MNVFGKNRDKEIHIRVTEEEYSWYLELKKRGFLVPNLLRDHLREIFFKAVKDDERKL